MFKKLISKFKGIDEFYSDLPSGQINLYQDYFEKLINSVKRGKGSALDRRRFSLNSLWIINSFARDYFSLSNFKG